MGSHPESPALQCPGDLAQAVVSLSLSCGVVAFCPPVATAQLLLCYMVGCISEGRQILILRGLRVQPGAQETLGSGATAALES